MPDGQPTDTLPDGAEAHDMADVTPSDNTTRGMGLVPVNPRKVTSLVGLGREPDDEFVVTRLPFSRPNRTRESLDDRDAKDRGEALYIARC